VICPRCQFQQPDGRECVRCGVVIAKARAPERSTQPFHVQKSAEVASAKPGAPPPATSIPVAAANPTTPPLPVDAAVRKAKALWARWQAYDDTRTPPARDRATLWQHLSRLLSGGVPLVEALDTARGVLGETRTARLVQAMRDEVRHGATLADAMRARPWAFDELDVALAAVAPNDRALGTATAHLHERWAAQGDPWRTVARELIWPGCVAASACLLLPIPRMVTAGGAAYAAAVMGNLIALAACAGLLLVVVPVVVDQRAVRLRLLAWGAQLPGAAVLVRDLRGSHLFGGLALALSGGLQPDEALHTVAQAGGDPGFTKEAERLAADVPVSGLAAALTQLPVVDPPTRALVEAGERAGDLPRALREIAAERQQRVQRNVKATALVVRAGVTAVLTLVIAIQVVQRVTAVMTDPLAMMSEQDGGELRRELDRALQPVAK
jgi:type II secretory pathway component PulF